MNLSGLAPPTCTIRLITASGRTKVQTMTAVTPAARTPLQSSSILLKSLMWISIIACGILVLISDIGNKSQPSISVPKSSDDYRQRNDTNVQPGLHMEKPEAGDKYAQMVVVKDQENTTEIMDTLLRRAKNISDDRCDKDAAEAQAALGALYSNGDPGLDVEVNPNAALYWYQEAIQNESKEICKIAPNCPAMARAKYGLGLMYLQGTAATPQNMDEAAALVERSAQLGCGIAQHSLGAMYFSGQGKAQNYTAATLWYQEAAAQNITESQDSLGFMYMNGLGGLAQDYAMAAEWFRRAAEAGNPEAQGYLGFLYYNGNGVPQSDQLASCWFQLSAQQGYKDSQDYLQKMIQEGRGSSVKRGRNGKIIKIEIDDCGGEAK